MCLRKYGVELFWSDFLKYAEKILDLTFSFTFVLTNSRIFIKNENNKALIITK